MTVPKMKKKIYPANQTEGVMHGLKYEPEDKPMLFKGSLSDVKYDPSKPETQPTMNTEMFYGGQGAMGELRDVERESWWSRR